MKRYKIRTFSNNFLEKIQVKQDGETLTCSLPYNSGVTDVKFKVLRGTDNKHIILFKKNFYEKRDIGYRDIKQIYIALAIQMMILENFNSEGLVKIILETKNRLYDEYSEKDKIENFYEERVVYILKEQNVKDLKEIMIKSVGKKFLRAKNENKNEQDLKSIEESYKLFFKNNPKLFEKNKPLIAGFLVTETELKILKKYTNLFKTDYKSENGNSIKEKIEPLFSESNLETISREETIKSKIFHYELLSNKVKPSNKQSYFDFKIEDGEEFILIKGQGWEEWSKITK